MLILDDNLGHVAYSICQQSADPYLNTDAGTMSPFEHGEVFVLDDGGEVFPSFQYSSTLPSIIMLYN